MSSLLGFLTHSQLLSLCNIFACKKPSKQNLPETCHKTCKSSPAFNLLQVKSTQSNSYIARREEGRIDKLFVPIDKGIHSWHQCYSEHNMPTYNGGFIAPKKGYSKPQQFLLTVLKLLLVQSNNSPLPLPPSPFSNQGYPFYNMEL